MAQISALSRVPGRGTGERSRGHGVRQRPSGRIDMHKYFIFGAVGTMALAAIGVGAVMANTSGTRYVEIREKPQPGHPGAERRRGAGRQRQGRHRLFLQFGVSGDVAEGDHDHGRSVAQRPLRRLGACDTGWSFPVRRSISECRPTRTSTTTPSVGWRPTCCWTAWPARSSWGTSGSPASRTSTSAFAPGIVAWTDAVKQFEGRDDVCPPTNARHFDNNLYVIETGGMRLLMWG